MQFYSRLSTAIGALIVLGLLIVVILFFSKNVIEVPISETVKSITGMSEDAQQSKVISESNRRPSSHRKHRTIVGGPLLVHMSSAGNDTIHVHVDSTMNGLSVIASFTPWSKEGIQYDESERRNGMQRTLGSYELIDPLGSKIEPDYKDICFMQWDIINPEIGDWRLEIEEHPKREYSISIRGSSYIYLYLLSTGSFPVGTSVNIRVRLEWAILEDVTFDLVDPYGDHISPISLNKIERRVYEGNHTFPEVGHYRVRIRGRLGSQTVERITMFCVNIRAASNM